MKHHAHSTDSNLAKMSLQGFMPLILQIILVAVSALGFIHYLDVRLAKIEERNLHIEAKYDREFGRVDGMEHRVRDVETRVSGMESLFKHISETMRDMQADIKLLLRAQGVRETHTNNTGAGAK